MELFSVSTGCACQLRLGCIELDQGQICHNIYILPSVLNSGEWQPMIQKPISGSKPLDTGLIGYRENW
jgi:hypothetical protein